MKKAQSGVLVTGATGFVGATLVQSLAGRGRPVTCLVRRTADAKELQRPDIRLVIGDLNNRKALREATDGIGTVYHIAGAIKARNREEFLQVNQIGTRNLLEAFAEAKPERAQFIHVSSLAAAGPSRENRALMEDETPNPISWYGESKLRSEEEVLRYARDLQVVILRPSAVYGPRDRETLMIFRMIKNGCMFTPGRFTRHFSLIHVQDLTTALLRVGEQEIPSGEIFFASRPEIYTWEDVGRSIARAVGRRYRRIAFPKCMAVAAGCAGDFWSRLSGMPATISSQKVKELLQPAWLCNPAKLWSCIGSNPEIKLDPGMEETATWYQSHGWL